MRHALRVPKSGRCDAGVLASLLLVCVGACVARFDGERFHKRAVDYRVGRLSAAWERTRIADNDLSFHRAGAGSISATATCEG
ncbi:MAG: hypothetical protein RL385_4464, partial [Pseudomonadota bacterium]